MNPSQTYDRTSQIAHWLLAAGLVFLIVYHPSTEEGHAHPSELQVGIHVSLGVVLMLLSVGRTIWRLSFAHIPPEPLGGELPTRVRRFTHGAFYFLMLLTPTVGGLLALSSQLDIQLVGRFEIPRLIAGENAHRVLRSLHGFTADLLLYLGLLHIGAALYHQFVLKDRLLERMIR